MMKRSFLSTICFLLVWAATQSLNASQQEPSSPRRARLAMVRLVGNTPELTQAIKQAMTKIISSDDGIDLLDQSLVDSAVVGFGYDGSFNLSRREARNLGAAIGCDFYLLVRSELRLVSRSSSRTESEAWAAVFLVNSRTGSLARFAWILETAEDDQRVISQMTEMLIERLGELLRTLKDSRLTPAQRSNESAVTLDLTRDSPPTNYTAPVFLRREQPAYTSEAERAEVSATVEIEAVFGDDGKVRDPEITRWAGYGLDQSALQAAERLRFTPATINGRPISVKGALRYNFTRRDASRAYFFSADSLRGECEATKPTGLSFSLTSQKT